MNISTIIPATGYNEPVTINIPEKNAHWVYQDKSKSKYFSSVDDYKAIVAYWHMGDYSTKKEAIA